MSWQDDLRALIPPKNLDKLDVYVDEVRAKNRRRFLVACGASLLGLVGLLAVLTSLPVPADRKSDVANGVFAVLLAALAFLKPRPSTLDLDWVDTLAGTRVLAATKKKMVDDSRAWADVEQVLVLLGAFGVAATLGLKLYVW